MKDIEMESVLILRTSLPPFHHQQHVCANRLALLPFLLFIYSEYIYYIIISVLFLFDLNYENLLGGSLRLLYLAHQR
ncbi:uncharacterized protein L203_104752 [Cryptococcus depauperatus CBS 7841]|uniref:Uncharacterized protein n=1 Tax=Cryptococcus depauperatus CBS 7841 TaxID=1295531 RepID=A0AAJ8JW20_9TREE